MKRTMSRKLFDYLPTLHDFSDPDSKLTKRAQGRFSAVTHHWDSFACIVDVYGTVASGTEPGTGTSCRALLEMGTEPGTGTGSGTVPEPFPERLREPKTLLAEVSMQAFPVRCGFTCLSVVSRNAST